MAEAFIKSDEAKRIAQEASFRVEGLLLMLRRELTRDGLDAEDMAFEIVVSHALRLNSAIMSVLCEDQAVSPEHLAAATGLEVRHG